MEESTAFIFNGDADGLCAQHLAYLHGARPDLRLTGVKRDIALLERFSHALASGSPGSRPLPARPSRPWRLLVFDISLRSNAAAAEKLLNCDDIHIDWFDHHEAGEIPDHPRLRRCISDASEICTSALVHRHYFRKSSPPPSSGSLPRPSDLSAASALWAAVGAFGDNMPLLGAGLLRLVPDLSLPDPEIRGGPFPPPEFPAAGDDPSPPANFSWQALAEMGQLFNYNAYGESLEDLHFSPAELALRLEPHLTPWTFLEQEEIISALRAFHRRDREHCHGLKPVLEWEGGAGYILPPEPWARRYGSSFANEKALARPGSALAVLMAKAEGGYVVSIRSPRPSKAAGAPSPSAAALAARFPSGGGRPLAAGINHLDADKAPAFLEEFRRFYSG